MKDIKLKSISLKSDIELIKKTLKDLGDKGYKAVVAGGWCRDILNNKIPKDIDIFVADTKEVPVNTVEEIFVDSSYIGNKQVVLDSEYSQTSFREDVRGLVKFTSGVDLILMSGSIEDVIKNFDTSICQVYAELNSEGELTFHALLDFLEYRDNNVIYTYSNIQTREDHLSRIREKYPGAEIKSKEVCDPYVCRNISGSTHLLELHKQNTTGYFQV